MTKAGGIRGGASWVLEIAGSTASDECSSSIGLASSERAKDGNSSSSDAEDDINVEAGADLRRGVAFDGIFVELLPFGWGDLNAGRPCFVGRFDDDDDAGMLGWVKFTRAGMKIKLVMD